MIRLLHSHSPLPRLYVGCLWLLALCASAWGMPVLNGSNPQHVSCSTGYERGECEQHIDKLKSVLLGFPIVSLGEWSWILVSSSEWKPLLQRLHLDERSIAFSSMDQRTVVLEEALFLSHDIRAERLARTLQVPVDQLVSLAVSHELGHILCHDGNESAAFRVAEQLRNGKRPECGGNAKSLTRMEELMYERSRSLGEPVQH